MGLYDHSDKKIYVVTLENKSDLEGFYSDMASDGYQLHLKRPISRSTEYYMNSTQAEDIRSDSRVAAVEINPDDDPIRIVEPFYDEVNNTPYGFNGDFEKSEFASQHGDNDRQWGHLHSSGSIAERRKGVFGHDVTASINENIEVFADGKHVDVVIVDNPVSFDCLEWNSPTTGLNRFVQYDWYTELNQYVSSIDDDGNAIPSGSYVYHPNSFNSTFHGNHVASTVAGQFYGWAREANIYSLHVNLGSGFGTPVTSTLVFDYLRAFHRYKPINPLTGKRNPTVTNHSWGSSYRFWSLYERDFDATGEVSGTADLAEVVIRGVTYNAANPGPSGWTNAGIHQDFGIGSGGRYSGGTFNYNADNMSTRYDMNDAIDEGVVIIAAAGNNDQYSIKANSLTPEFADWNNKVVLNLPSGSQYSFNHHRGSSPSNAHGCITVGSISNNSDFRKSDFSNFGPMIDVWAPGDKIQGAWPDPNNIYQASGYNGIGYLDNKYGGTNWRYTIGGTSMASPQVCGIAALLATGKERFTNSDVMGFIQKYSYENEMTFDVNGGLFDDRTASGGANPLHGGSTSTTREIRAINPRNVSGLIDGWYKETLKGERRPSYMFYGAQMYPRTNTYYRSLPSPILPITLTAVSGNYIMTGSDRQTTFNDTPDPAIVINQGDILKFTGSVFGDHPMWITKTQTTGQPSLSNQPDGVADNGTKVGPLVWNTTGVPKETYHYNCEYHGSMHGTITII